MGYATNTAWGAGTYPVSTDAPNTAPFIWTPAYGDLALLERAALRRTRRMCKA